MSYYTVATVSQCDASREWFIQHFRHHQMVHPHFFFYTTALWTVCFSGFKWNLWCASFVFISMYKLHHPAAAHDIFVKFLNLYSSTLWNSVPLLLHRPPSPTSVPQSQSKTGLEQQLILREGLFLKPFCRMVPTHRGPTYHPVKGRPVTVRDPPPA